MKNALDARQILGLQPGLRHERLEVVSGRDLKEKEANYLKRTKIVFRDAEFNYTNAEMVC